jgi:hypothetical protein
MSAIDQRRARSLPGASTPAWGLERLPRRSLTATPGQPVFGGPCLSSGADRGYRGAQAGTRLEEAEPVEVRRSRRTEG